METMNTQQQEAPIYLSPRAYKYITSLRDRGNEGYHLENSSIANAMAIVTHVTEQYDNDEWQKNALYMALNTLSDFNYLLTELVKEEDEQ